MQLFYSSPDSLAAAFQLYKERSFMRKVSFLFGFYKMSNFVLRIELGISQQTVSKIEQSETVEEETLGKIAKILGVTIWTIRNFMEDTIINHFALLPPGQGNGTL
uniref:helix-turn-helix domain-containing protein n=1 Tax=Pedobacter schmidteae TaxID=2201271 RepID=UPI0018D51B65|nr:helix-turn-helix transcriptional regulator [Pedobacter schmidteae]